MDLSDASRGFNGLQEVLEGFESNLGVLEASGVFWRNPGKSYGYLGISGIISGGFCGCQGV